MHDLSFKTGVKNIDMWREQDRLAGIAPGDSRMTNDVCHLPAVGVGRGLGEGCAFGTHPEKEDSGCRAALTA